MARTQGRPWKPIASGPQARACWRTVGEIADAIATVDHESADPSLAAGNAGLALLYATLCAAGREAGSDEPEREKWAWQELDIAAEALSNQPLDWSLYAGVPGIAWSVEVVGQLLDRSAADRNADVDAVLLELARRPRYPAESYDLVRGIVGLGVYALRRYPRAAAAECLELVVHQLWECARLDKDGAYWWTPSSDMPDPEDRRVCPAGCVDLGVAHGVSGVIALLGHIRRTGVAADRVERLLREALRWLMRQGVPDQHALTFPVWVAPNLEPTPSRTAWCYGDPGVAAALLAAALVLDDRQLTTAALDLARRAARRPYALCGVVDACFCHGSAGLAHIYNRMYQQTDCPELGRAARLWLGRTLGIYRRARTRAVGPNWVAGGSSDTRPWTGLDIVDGAAGIALVVLSAVSDLEPEWDGMFLLSPGSSPAHGP